MPKKPIIGSGLKLCDKAPRFHRTDPNKHIPFAREPETHAPGYWMLYAIFIIAAVVFFAAGPKAMVTTLLGIFAIGAVAKLIWSILK